MENLMLEVLLLRRISRSGRFLMSRNRMVCAYYNTVLGALPTNIICQGLIFILLGVLGMTICAQDDRQALIAIAILAGIKVADSIIHYLNART